MAWAKRLGVAHYSKQIMNGCAQKKGGGAPQWFPFRAGLFTPKTWKRNGAMCHSFILVGGAITIWKNMKGLSHI